MNKKLEKEIIDWVGKIVATFLQDGNIPDITKGRLDFINENFTDKQTLKEAIEKEIKTHKHSAGCGTVCQSLQNLKEKLNL